MDNIIKILKIIESLLKSFILRLLKPFLSSKIIKKGKDRDLYRTRFGYYFWLDKTKYIDQRIIETGIYEKDSTEVVRKIIKTGDFVLDIGANIGYYTILFSRLVGDSGVVFCFEPTKLYRDVLLRNIESNNITNCKILEFGLSNKEKECQIYITDSTATLHLPGENVPYDNEKIILRRLDDISSSLGLSKINFIKVDIDGDEPAFLEGAWKTIQAFKPTILLEVSHRHYLESGITAWDFYSLLNNKGFFIYSVPNLEEIKTRDDFLIKCGNFAYSANILISLEPLNLLASNLS